MQDFLLTNEEKELQEEVRSFVESVDRELILAMDEEKVKYPLDYIEDLAKNSLLGLRFPKEVGGRGLGWKEEVVALEEIGVLGTSLACLYSLPSIVGEALHHFGTCDQKKRYLKPTLAGTLCTAEALTEPRGGSDFFGATTIAKKVEGGYRIRGQKRFIVGAEGAHYFMVYARTDTKASWREGMSAFLVDRGEGVQVEALYGLMGTRGGGTGRLRFKDVFVPEENLLGEEGDGGKIFYQMMIPERMTSAAGALGMARGALNIAAEYSTKRKAFGRPIKDFEGVSFKIADSITQLDAARSLVLTAAKSIDTNSPSALQRRMVSQAKKFATQMAWDVVNHSMQVLGGIGYTNVYPLERLLRDIRLIMIWTGTNEIMDLIIQHEYYKEIRDMKKGRDLEGDALGSEEEKVFE